MAENADKKADVPATVPVPDAKPEPKQEPAKIPAPETKKPAEEEKKTTPPEEKRAKEGEVTKNVFPHFHMLLDLRRVQGRGEEGQRGRRRYMSEV